MRQRVSFVFSGDDATNVERTSIFVRDLTDHDQVVLSFNDYEGDMHEWPVENVCIEAVKEVSPSSHG